MGLGQSTLGMATTQSGELDPNSMNLEANRIRSFVNWPRDAPIDSIEIARNGFYATNHNLEVKCNWCGVLISNWMDIGRDPNNNIAMKHQSLNPNCPFVLDPITAGNIISIERSFPAEIVFGNYSNRSNSDSRMLDVSARLATFTHWPNPYISPEALARVGMYYLGEDDKVKCAWCHGVIAQWEEYDDPYTEHRKFFPNCARSMSSNNVDLASSEMQALGIQPMVRPKQTMYSALPARLRTFDTWPRSDIQNPEELAKAGFYFQKIDDEVRCFHCNGGLRSWQSEDDPWTEHAKYFPTCHFVKLIKGENFVDTVNKNFKAKRLSEAMKTDIVQNALQMGFEESKIKAALRYQLETSNKPFHKIDGLIDAVVEERFGNHTTESGDTNIVSIGESSSSLHSQSEGATVNSPDDEGKSNHSLEKLANVSLRHSSNEAIDLIRGEPLHMTLEEENRRLKDARLCKICMDEEVGVLYVPCAHLVTCLQCAQSITSCPLCRKEINGFIKTFLP